MFRQIAPRVLRNVARLRACPQRSFGDRSRWVPVRRRFFDDFWPSPMSRMMDRQMNHMWKTMDEMSRPMARFWEPYYEHQPARPGKDVQVKFNDQVFEVRLDVRDFAPEELNVKLAGENLTISAKHEEKADEHGFISREFTRQFAIPESVEPETFESQLTTDGYLVIKGKVRGAEDVTERVINITREQPEKEQSSKDKKGD